MILKLGMGNDDDEKSIDPPKAWSFVVMWTALSFHMKESLIPQITAFFMTLWKTYCFWKRNHVQMGLISYHQAVLISFISVRKTKHSNLNCLGSKRGFWPLNQLRGGRGALPVPCATAPVPAVSVSSCRCFELCALQCTSKGHVWGVKSIGHRCCGTTGFLWPNQYLWFHSWPVMPLNSLTGSVFPFLHNI